MIGNAIDLRLTSKIRVHGMSPPLRHKANHSLLLQRTKIPYLEVLLVPFLLSGPGHLWNLGALQAPVVPSVLEALGEE